MEDEKIRMGISACLLGQPVRYDGGHKLDVFLRDAIGRFVEYVPVCPEAEAGLGIPREPMQLEGGPKSHGMPSMITIETRRDMTGTMVTWAERRLEELAKDDLRGFILKSRSPSCGVGSTPAFSGTGEVTEMASGIFAAMLMRRFPLLPVVDEARLADPEASDRFFGRVFGAVRWLALRKSNFFRMP